MEFFDQIAHKLAVCFRAALGKPPDCARSKFLRQTGPLAVGIAQAWYKFNALFSPTCLHRARIGGWK
jgi:hypothetical protein